MDESAEISFHLDHGSFGVDLARFQSLVASSLSVSKFTAWNPSYVNLAKQLKAGSEMFSSMLQTSNFQKLLATLGRNTPYNFSDILISEQLDLIEISKVYRFGTVEILPPSIISSLLESGNTPSLVNELLLDGKGEITDLCLEIAEALKLVPLFADYGVLFEKGIDALQKGHFEASQALTTNLWDTFLCEKVGRNNMITKAKQLAPEPIVDDLIDFAPIYAYASYAPAIASYTVDPKSSDYSRNGTVHHVSTSTANLLNSIKSITICGGVLARDWRLSPLHSNN